MSQLTSSRFFVFVLALVLIGVITAAAKENYRKYQINKETGIFKEEIEFLKEKNKSLSNLLNYFNSEKSLEKEARLKFNLLKEGEKLVIISPNEKADLTKNQSLEYEESNGLSNFKKWRGYLFDKDFKE